MKWKNESYVDVEDGIDGVQGFDLGDEGMLRHATMGYG
jgi:hypothetical protein